MNDESTPKKNVRFSHVELLVCRKLYPNFETIRQALPHRSMAAIKSQCQQMGLTRPDHRWTHKEIERLRVLYPSTPLSEIAKEFPFATLGMLRAQANKHGIYRSITREK
ncbi:hypothetical protein FHW16_003327 [Phyllobacterium myrsinacearum]|uniref:Uncharacterized protein n=1 Tax=Phyllobacterium myrsinacearum TaxID=28101 RepID=A0A839EMW3_9HYPH|nr:hypothetical protein [Phyllobacterium myrsinacearum]